MDNSPDDGPCEVTITAPDREWLQALVRQYVEEGVAAAAHVDIMHTTYRWAGQVHEADEARAVLHASRRNLDEITARVRAEHVYEVACVAAVDIVAGEPRYLEWIKESTRG